MSNSNDYTTDPVHGLIDLRGQKNKNDYWDQKLQELEQDILTSGRVSTHRRDVINKLRLIRQLIKADSDEIDSQESPKKNT